MLRAWRIVSPRHADAAFSGEGARRYGGRWNSKGTPLIYTAQSQALAMLEMLVQDEPLRARYVVIPAEIPEALQIRRVSLKELPANWNAPEQLEALREIGTEWAFKQTSAVLAVPSVVVPSETNYVLNPLHSEFTSIKIGKPMPFVTDLRLLKKLQP